MRTKLGGGIVLVAALAVLALVLAVGGCTKDGTENGKQASNVKDVTKDCDEVVELSSEATQTVTLKKGDRVALLVETNATIPYADVLMEKPDGLTFVEMRDTQPDTGGEPIAGAGYTAVWVFDASAAGDGLLRIEKWPLENIELDETTGLWHLKTGVDPAEGDGQTWDLEVRVTE